MRRGQSDGYGIWLIRSRLGLAALITLAVAAVLSSLPWLPIGVDSLDPKQRMIFLDFLSGLAVLSALITASARESLKKAVREAEWDIKSQQFTQIRQRIRFFAVLNRECMKPRNNSALLAFLLISLPLHWSSFEWKEKLERLLGSKVINKDAVTTLEHNRIGVLIAVGSQAEAYAVCKEIWQRLVLLVQDHKGLEVTWAVSPTNGSDPQALMNHLGITVPDVASGAILGGWLPQNQI